MDHVICFLDSLDSIGNQANRWIFINTTKGLVSVTFGCSPLMKLYQDVSLSTQARTPRHSTWVGTTGDEDGEADVGRGAPSEGPIRRGGAELNTGPS